MESELNQHMLTNCRWFGSSRGVSSLGSPSVTVFDVNCSQTSTSASARRNEVHTITRFRVLSMSVSRGLGWVHVVDGKVLFDPS